MKATILLVLVLLSVLSSGPKMARAFEVTGVAIAIPLEGSIDVTALVVAHTPTTSGEVEVDDKQAYFAQLRDDAAEQIADGDAPSPVLADAIQQIRAQTGTTASDRDLSLAILKALD